MLRLLLLPLFLFTLSMVCMGQTFQYSRGWTNGKRATPSALLNSGHNLGLLDAFEMQEKSSDVKLERCLMQLQHLAGNALLHHSFANGLAYNGNRPDPTDLNIHARPRPSANNNDNNLLYPRVNQHQSNELYETVSDPVEPADFGKH
ncbi:PREDICTED: pro-corazonin [Drosophila arizonae]|uniref:Pro-corazonin n=1 Tax=Drosophila arizonae TaxID=7263 RepID=A0ABM1Q1R0_DROAR|nr:PREDICTED: pro-corazonin [Drosophila arizonae]XP_017873396.1 PREDICTED: pro-corazonin [Drosophila arizonae]